MSIETGLFSFWLSVVSLLQFLVVCIITVLWKNFKKSGKNKNKLRTISPKNHENFKNSKSRVVLLVLIKGFTSVGRRKPLQLNQGSTLSFRWHYFFYFQSKSPFVYKIINKKKTFHGKFSKTKSSKYNGVFKFK